MKSIYSALLFVLGTFMLTSSNYKTDPVPKHETFTIQSHHLGELRTINVWLPEGYNYTDSLPVLYMLDGGVKEDFPHIANTLQKLIKKNKINPILLVGIENTQRRRDLTGFTEVAKDKEVAPIVGESEKFRAFVRDEVIPEINKRYKTITYKGIIGESLAGLFVMETFLQSPELFDFYIAFDPSLWWNDHYLVKTAKEKLAQFPTSEKQLWFAGSSATDISQYTNAMAQILKEVHLPNLKWTYSDEPKEKHVTIFRATKEKAISWSLGTSK